GGGGYGDGHPTGRRLAVLAIVQGDVPRVVQKMQRPRRPRPGAVHVVRYLNLPGVVVLGKPPDQQIPAGDRAGECDGGRQDPIPGRECRPLDEGRGDRLADGRARKESCEGGHHGKASTGRGRRQKFHWSFTPLQSENGESGSLPGIRLDSMSSAFALRVASNRRAGAPLPSLPSRASRLPECRTPVDTAWHPTPPRNSARPRWRSRLMSHARRFR